MPGNLYIYKEHRNLRTTSNTRTVANDHPTFAWALFRGKLNSRLCTGPVLKESPIRQDVLKRSANISERGLKGEGK